MCRIDGELAGSSNSSSCILTPASSPSGSIDGVNPIVPAEVGAGAAGFDFRDRPAAGLYPQHHHQAPTSAPNLASCPYPYPVEHPYHNHGEWVFTPTPTAYRFHPYQVAGGGGFAPPPLHAATPNSSAQGYVPPPPPPFTANKSTRYPRGGGRHKAGVGGGMRYHVPVNWQPWRADTVSSDHEESAGLDGCSNAAGAGVGGRSQERVAGIGVKENDFRSEWERSQYINGWGLPASGPVVEDRLLRAINMNHYILVGHIDKGQREIKEHLNDIIAKDRNTKDRNALRKELCIANRKIDSLWEILGKQNGNDEVRPVESSFVSPSDESPAPPHLSPSSIDEEDNHSVKHLELAILKLWAHIDKIKGENQLCAGEIAERTEIEELLASEILYHNNAMEKMQAKIKSMGKEVSCCWTAIRDLQDAVKGLGGNQAGTGEKLPSVGVGKVDQPEASTRASASNTATDPEKLLEKINQELENLNVKLDGGSIAQEGDEDECACDLCGRAKAGKSAGVTVTVEQDDDDNGGDTITAKRSIYFMHDLEEGEEDMKDPTGESPPRLGACMAERGFTVLNATIFNNKSGGSNSPPLQKWQEMYVEARTGEQKVIQMLRPNYETVLLLVEPTRLPAKEGVKRKRNTDCIDSLEYISWGYLEEKLGTRPGYDGDRDSAVSPFKNPQLVGQQKKVPLFTPLPAIARTPIPTAGQWGQPKFGCYGFPQVDAPLGKKEPQASQQGNVKGGADEVSNPPARERRRSFNRAVEKIRQHYELENDNERFAEAKEQLGQLVGEIADRETQLRQLAVEVEVEKRDESTSSFKPGQEVQYPPQQAKENADAAAAGEDSTASILATINATLVKMSERMDKMEEGTKEKEKEGAVPRPTASVAETSATATAWQAALDRRRISDWLTNPPKAPKVQMLDVDDEYDVQQQNYKGKEKAV